MNSINDLAPNVWLHGSVGRATHRQRGGHGLESRWSPDFFFFRLLLSNCLNWKIYCDDHSSLSSTTAVQIWIILYTSHRLNVIWPCPRLYTWVKSQCGNSVIYATTRQAPETLRRARISSLFIFIWCGKSLKYPEERCWTFLLLFSFIWRRFNYSLCFIRIIFIINGLFCFILLAPLLEKISWMTTFQVRLGTIQLTNRGNRTKQNNFLVWNISAWVYCFDTCFFKSLYLSFQKRVWIFN